MPSRKRTLVMTLARNSNPLSLRQCCSATVAQLGNLDRYRTEPGQDLALGLVGVAHQGTPATRIVIIMLRGNRKPPARSRDARARAPCRATATSTHLGKSLAGETEQRYRSTWGGVPRGRSGLSTSPFQPRTPPQLISCRTPDLAISRVKLLQSPT